MSHGIMIHCIIHSNYFAISDWLHQFDGNLPGVIDFKPFAPSLLKKRVHGYPKTKKLNV